MQEDEITDLTARLEAAEAREKRKSDAIWSLTAWLLHRFGPDTPEGREAQTARAALTPPAKETPE
jgi:hypothetical protein